MNQQIVDLPKVWAFRIGNRQLAGNMHQKHSDPVLTPNCSEFMNGGNLSEGIGNYTIIFHMVYE